MKKAQSTLEFLLTYGWALMVVLTIIGLLAYFGVMNPRDFLTEQCAATSSMNCMGNAVTNSTHSLIVLNNKVHYGYTLNSTNTQLQTGCSAIEFCDKNGLNCANSKLMSINGELMIKLTCDNSASSRVKREFLIRYINPLSGLSEDTTIYIISKVRE